MQHIFLKLVNLSISANILILAAMILRLLLKKAPKWFNCLLWAIVAVRLVVPFSLESNLSLAPRAEIVRMDENLSRPVVQSGFENVDESINAYIGVWYTQQSTNTIAEEPKTAFDIVGILSKVWIAGVVLLIGYAFYSYARVYRSVRCSIRIKRNVYYCDGIDMPFILGVIRPTIYLPSTLSEVECDNILAHEEAHIKRGDFLWKPLGFLLLAVYWFNPFMWVAYILLCRDIEMACDEKVVRDMTIAQKKQYSRVLLSFSAPDKMLTVCPLAFGEVGVKDRVKGVLNYRKPTFWILVSAVVACIVVMVFFLTNPKSNEAEIIPTESTTSGEEQQSTSPVITEEAIDVSKYIPISELFLGRNQEEIQKYLAELPKNPDALAQIGCIFGWGYYQMDYGAQKKWNAFYEKVQQGFPAETVFVETTDEGGYLYTYVDYDGKDYYLLKDRRDDMHSDRSVTPEIARYLTCDRSAYNEDYYILFTDIDGYDEDDFRDVWMNENYDNLSKIHFSFNLPLESGVPVLQTPISLADLSHMVLGQYIVLPGEHWTTNVRYQAVSECEMVVQYDDVIADANCELRALRGEGVLEIPTLKNPEQVNWGGNNSDGKYVLALLQTDSENGVAVITWECEECKYVLTATGIDLSRRCEDVIAKTALHLIKNLGNSGEKHLQIPIL